MLLNLPAEIIYRIAEEVEPNLPERRKQARSKVVCDKAETLSSLSLVCSRLRILFVPLLFEKISYKLHHDFYSQLRSGHPPINTLAQYPDLAIHVR